MTFFVYFQTFALPESTIPSKALEIWYTVRAAQGEAYKKARNGTVTADVDKAARHVMDVMGYSKYFTHRLGHGESDYPFDNSTLICIQGLALKDTNRHIYEGGQMMLFAWAMSFQMSQASISRVILASGSRIFSTSIGTVIQYT